jgi:cellular nucleic acid-binding protein
VKCNNCEKYGHTVKRCPEPPAESTGGDWGNTGGNSGAVATGSWGDGGDSSGGATTSDWADASTAAANGGDSWGDADAAASSGW